MYSSPSEAVLFDFVRLSSLLIENIGNVNDDEKAVIWTYISPLVSHYDVVPCDQRERRTVRCADGKRRDCCVVEGRRYLKWEEGCVIEVPSDQCMEALQRWRKSVYDDILVDMRTGEWYLWGTVNGRRFSLVTWNKATDKFDRVFAANVVIRDDSGRYPTVNVHDEHIIFSRTIVRLVKDELTVFNVKTKKLVARGEIAHDGCYAGPLLLRDQVWMLGHKRSYRVYNVFTGESIHLHPFFRWRSDNSMGNVGGEPSLTTIAYEDRMVIVDHRLNRVCPLSVSVPENCTSLVCDASGRLHVLNKEISVCLNPVFAHETDKSFPFILSSA